MEDLSHVHGEVLGFVGLGNMGAAMAQKIVEHGEFKRVVVWNRSPQKSQAFLAAIARLRPESGKDATPTSCTESDKPGWQAVASSVSRVEDLAVACNGQSLVLMLLDDEATESVVDAILATGAFNHGVLVNCATISIDCVARIDAKVSDFNLKQTSGTSRAVSFCNCAVTGRPEHMHSRRACSWIACSGASGDTSVVDFVSRKIASTWSKHTKIISNTDVTASAKFKISTNFLIYGASELMSEALVLLDACGIQRENLLDFTGGFASGSFMDLYAKKLVRREFGDGVTEIGASVDVGLKDLRLMDGIMRAASVQGGGDVAGTSRQELPTLSVMLRHMKMQSERCGELSGKREWCSFLEAIEQEAKVARRT